MVHVGSSPATATKNYNMENKEDSRQKQIIELNIIIFNLTQAQKIIGAEAKQLTPEMKMFLKENAYRLLHTMEYSETFLNNAQLTKDLN